MIEHITSINAPRLCIMHNPCCPAPALAPQYREGKFSLWLSESVSCCRPALLPCLFINLFWRYYPSNHAMRGKPYSGPSAGQATPVLLVCARKLHLAGCAALKPTCPAMICDAFPPVFLYAFSRRGSASTAQLRPSTRRALCRSYSSQTFGSFGPA